MSSHGLTSVCACIPILSSPENISHIGAGPAHVGSFYCNNQLKGTVSKYSHILRYWGLNFNIKIGGGGAEIQPIAYVNLHLQIYLCKITF